MSEILLFSKGSTLKEIPPDFQGMPLKQWINQQITEQCNEALKTAPERPLMRQWTKRDDYGKKSA